MFIYTRACGSMGLPWWLRGKEFTCQSRRFGLDPWVRKIPWRRKWQPTPLFLPGESHGQRSLVGCSPWNHRVRHDWCDLAHTQEGSGAYSTRWSQDWQSVPSPLWYHLDPKWKDGERIARAADDHSDGSGTPTCSCTGVPLTLTDICHTKLHIPI